MKKAVVAVVAGVFAISIVGVAFALTAGKPEIDKAAARFGGMPVSPPVVTNCPGEDGDPYRQVNGTWRGPISDSSPVPGDFSMNGKLKLELTLVTNGSTRTGEALGPATVFNATGTKVFTGQLTAVTQSNQDQLQARGMLIGSTASTAGTPADRLVANVVFTINASTQRLIGSYGGSSPGVPDLSIKDNNHSCV